MIDTDAKKKARRRALRAAQAVTLGLAIATGGAGCFGTHGRARVPAPDAEGDAATAVDASAPERDAGAEGGDDAGPRFEDAGFADPDAALADAGVDGGDMMLCDTAHDWAACCNEHGWDPAWGCSAWGPFVPPAERAHLPASA